MHYNLESTTLSRWPYALRDIWSVASPGDRVVISVVDFAALARGFTAGETSLDECRRALLGTLHTRESVRADLESRGFVGVSIEADAKHPHRLVASATKPRDAA